jgi:hypothetical protein
MKLTARGGRVLWELEWYMGLTTHGGDALTSLIEGFLLPKLLDLEVGPKLYWLVKN